MKNRWPRWSLAGDHRVSSRSVIAKREGHDHQGQRVFGRGVRPRVDNSYHRGQRVYEGFALAVLYVVNISKFSSKHARDGGVSGVASFITFFSEDFPSFRLFDTCYMINDNTFLLEENLVCKNEQKCLLEKCKMWLLHYHTYTMFAADIIILIFQTKSK